MELDLTELPPHEATQVQMFVTVVESMPTPALEMLVRVLESELRERRSADHG